MTTAEFATRKGNLYSKLSALAVSNRKKTVYGKLCRKDILKIYLLGWWREIADGYTVNSSDNAITEAEMLNILNESEKLVV